MKTINLGALPDCAVRCALARGTARNDARSVVPAISREDAVKLLALRLLDLVRELGVALFGERVELGIGIRDLAVLTDHENRTLEIRASGAGGAVLRRE